MTVDPPQLPKLYAKQQAAIFDPARYTLIEASTKAGKTAGCLIWIFVKAWNEGKPGRNFWWVAPVHAQAKIAYSRLKRMLSGSDPDRRIFSTNETELWIELASGGRVWFKGSDRPDTLYGDDVYAAVIDEASRCKESSWHAVRSTLTSTGGSVKIIGNVRGRRNWAYKIGQRARAGEVGMSYHKLTAIDAVEGGILPASEVEDARRIMPPDVFDELYLAKPTEDGSCPFGLAAIKNCHLELSTEPAAAYGIDLAKSFDHTVLCGLDAAGRACRLDRWQSDWGQTRRRILDAIGNVPTLVDSTGVGDPIVEDLIRERPNVEGFKFSATSKQQLMEGLASAIQRQDIRFPEGWLTDELESFEFEYYKGGVRYSAPEGLHDDGVCALALANRRRGMVVQTVEIKVIDMGSARRSDDHLWQPANRW